VWNQEFVFDDVASLSHVMVKLQNESGQELGEATIALTAAKDSAGAEHTSTYNLIRNGKPGGTLCTTVKWVPQARRP
jgi:hypothetical protein